jgi:hypothetical protein
MTKYSANKDVAKIVHTLVKSGWLYKMGGRHGKLIAPSGRSLTVPCSPSDHRAARNFRQDARKAEKAMHQQLIA